MMRKACATNASPGSLEANSVEVNECYLPFMVALDLAPAANGMSSSEELMIVRSESRDDGYDLDQHSRSCCSDCDFLPPK